MFSNIYFSFLYFYQLLGFIPSFTELMLRAGQLSIATVVFSVSF